MLSVGTETFSSRKCISLTHKVPLIRAVIRIERMTIVSLRLSVCCNRYQIISQINSGCISRKYPHTILPTSAFCPSNYANSMKRYVGHLPQYTLLKELRNHYIARLAGKFLLLDSPFIELRLSHVRMVLLVNFGCTNSPPFPYLE